MTLPSGKHYKEKMNVPSVPPGWLLAWASEDWRQISVKPAVAATPAAVLMMQQNYRRKRTLIRQRVMAICIQK